MIEIVITYWDKIFTVFFAGLSAIFAGISAWLLGLEYRRNNPKIVVKMNLAFLDISGRLEDMVVFSIENHGRRTVSISSWYLEDDNKRSMFLFEGSDIFFQNVNFPRELSEQQTIKVQCYTQILREAVKERGFKIQRICFSDAL